MNPIHERLYNFLFKKHSGCLVIILLIIYGALISHPNDHPYSFYIAFLVFLIFMTYIFILELLKKTIKDNDKNIPLLGVIFIGISILFCMLLAAIPASFPIAHESASTSPLSCGSFIDVYPSSFYYTTSTFSTLGYGDILPTNRNGKMFACLTALFGLTHSVVFVTVILSSLVNNQERNNDKA